MKICCNSRVDGVIFLHAVERVRLRPLDNLLCIVEEEHAEQDQAAVDGDGIQACSKRRGGWEEHRPCRETELFILTATLKCVILELKYINYIWKISLNIFLYDEATLAGFLFFTRFL